MVRPADTVAVEIVGGNRLENFTSLAISNDLTAPSEAAFELGNDGTWPDIRDQIANGTQYSVMINNRLRMTGRVEVHDLPMDSSGGSVVRFTVRTKLADAMYASARPNIKVKDVTIRDFILALYADLGYTAADFEFQPSTARDLLTGKPSKGSNAEATVDIETMTTQDAKVNPPETVYEAADRHLRRHGLIHWDGPKGNIVVGAPNDTQDPLYKLVSNTGAAGAQNNVLGSTVNRDWSGIPSAVTVIGQTVRRGTSRKRVAAIEIDSDVTAAGFYRPVVFPAEGVRNAAAAARAAAREMTARRKMKDSIDVALDGLSFWNGSENVNWGIDTVVTYESNIAGGGLGPYLVHRVVCRRDAMSGDTTNLSIIKKGLWAL